MSVPAKNTAIVAVLTEEDYQKVEKEWEAKGMIKMAEPSRGTKAELRLKFSGQPVLAEMEKLWEDKSDDTNLVAFLIDASGPPQSGDLEEGQ